MKERSLIESYLNEEKDLSDEEKEKIYKRWDSLINMSPSELKKFMDSEEGKKAGLSKKQADKEGIDYGRESAGWIIKMQGKNYKKWTSKMWEWANKQISFISRMKGVKGPLRDDKGKPTRKLLALKIWGHNPEK